MGLRPLSLILLSTSLAVLFGCAAGMKQSPLQVVSHVDLNRYLGTWYEIARFPNRFQEGCVASRATYTLLEDGKIGVLNRLPASFFVSISYMCWAYRRQGAVLTPDGSIRDWLY